MMNKWERTRLLTMAAGGGGGRGAGTGPTPGDAAKDSPTTGLPGTDGAGGTVGSGDSGGRQPVSQSSTGTLLAGPAADPANPGPKVDAVVQVVPTPVDRHRDPIDMGRPLTVPSNRARLPGGADPALIPPQGVYPDRVEGYTRPVGQYGEVTEDGIRKEDGRPRGTRRGDEGNTVGSLDDLVAESTGRRDEDSVILLLDACDRFGINPSKNAKPLELASWRFYGGTTGGGRGVPDSVVLITSGGLKLRMFEDPEYPMDPDTEDRLRRVFNSWVVDTSTREIKPAALPVDMALPVAVITGEIPTRDHQYAGGYLRSGGKKAADLKEQRAAERKKRLGL